MSHELTEKIRAMFGELHADGYEGKHEKVLELVREARGVLVKSHGKVGPWEAEELARAEVSVKCNFLRLALHEIEKAIDVSELPKDEYDYGFNYTKRCG